MIKKLTMCMALFFLIVFSFVQVPVVQAQANDDPEVVYFYTPRCLECQSVIGGGHSDDGLDVIDALRNDGITVTTYNIADVNPLNRIMGTDVGRIYSAYIWAYDVPDRIGVPIIFAGEDYYYNYDDIREGYDQGLIHASAQDPLRDISGYVPDDLGFFTLLFMMIGGGLLDGINPCAIAMLLMFISIMGFTKKSKTLIVITVSYIVGIVVIYFAIGLGLLSLFGLAEESFENFSRYLYIFLIGLFSFLFVLTMYDFFMTRSQKYENVKNQLPSAIRNFNKRLIEKMSKLIEEENGFKRNFLVVFIPFLIGVIIGITEAACTGQLYITAIAIVMENSPATGVSFYEIFFILVFNIAFIIPLSLIAFIAIKSRNVMSISNFVREHLSWIKLATSVFFLAMIVYFLTLIL